MPTPHIAELQHRQDVPKELSKNFSCYDYAIFLNLPDIAELHHKVLERKTNKVTPLGRVFGHPV